MREGEGDHDKGQEVAIKGDSTSYLIDQLEELYAKLVSFMHAYMNEYRVDCSKS